jgi:filamentous hemagglutinin
VRLDLDGDLTNAGGTIAGRQLVSLSANNVHNLGARIQGDRVSVAARTDLNNIGGSLAAQSALEAHAGRDLNLVSTTHSAQSALGASSASQTRLDRVAGLYVSQPAATLLASAGRDLTLVGGVIQSQGSASVVAGRDLDLGTLTQTRAQDLSADARNYARASASQEVGSTVLSEGSLRLQAGADLNARAANVQAQGELVASAGNNLTLSAGLARQSDAQGRHVRESGLLSSRSTTTRDSLEQTTAQATLLGGRTVLLQAGQDIAVQGSSVTAQAGIAVVAGGDITLVAAQNSHDESHFSDTRKSGLGASGYSQRGSVASDTLRQTTNTASSLDTATGNLTVAANLNANADVNKGLILIEGSHLNADSGSIELAAKHILLTPSADQTDSTHSLKQSKSTWALATGLPGGKQLGVDANRTRSQLNASTLDGASGVTLNAPGIIDLSAAQLKAAQGDIRITGGDVSIQSGLDQTRADAKEASKKTGVNLQDLTGAFKPGQGVGFKSTLTTHDAQTRIAPATLEAQNIAIRSTAGDITLGAVEATARGQTAPPGAQSGAQPDTPPGTITLDAARNLTLASLTTTQQHSTDLQKKDLAWQVVKGSGTVDETTQYTRLNADQLSLNAGNRISADLSVKASAAILATEPGMGWLQQLQADPALNNKIDWNKIEEAHQSWNYKQQGLTPAAAVVVAVVVAYFTAGAGSAALGTTTATAAGTTTTLAGTTLATTTAAGAVGYTTAGVIVNAAVTTLASQAAVSFINNGGRLDQTLQDLGSKHNLRQLATSLATAGVLSEVGQFNFGSAEQPFTLNSVSVKDGFAANAGKNLLTGLARASVNSAVTGTDLQTSLRTEVVASILNAASAQGANFVGDQALAGGLLNDAGQVNEFARAFAHAVVGCAAGAAGASAPGSATGGASGCGAGALGAVVGELSAQLYGSANPSKTIAFASMMSGIAAAAAGLDAQAVAIAASTGANAAQNNYLAHSEAMARAALKDKQAKGTLSAAEQQQLTNLEVLDIARDLALKDACQTQGDACNAARRDLNGAIASYATASAMTNPRLSPAGNAAVNAEKDQAIALNNAPSLASQELWDSFKEFAGPQAAGYVAGAVIDKFIGEAQAVYAAIKAESGVVPGAVASGANAGTKVAGANGGVVEASVTSGGTANAATVPGLKGQLAAENLANIAAQDARLAKAVSGDGGKLNFSVGSGTAAEANQLGKTWVGDGAQLVADQVGCPGCWKSADGLRIYRPSTPKNAPSSFNPTGVQANFVTLSVNPATGSSTIVGNGHLVVLP